MCAASQTNRFEKVSSERTIRMHICEQHFHRRQKAQNGRESLGGSLIYPCEKPEIFLPALKISSPTKKRTLAAKRFAKPPVKLG
jgi:hypothetical protein